MNTVLYAENRGHLQGGGQRSLLDLLAGLDRAQYAPLLLCPEEGSLGAAARALGIPVHLLDLPALRGNPGRVALAVWKVRRLLVAQGVDLVHANGSRCLFYAGLAARLAGVPVLWHVRIAESDGAWDRVLYGLADRVVAVSGVVRQRFAWSGRAEKVRVVPNGVDLAPFAAADGRTLRAELGAVDGPLVGMVAHLTEEKDPETFVEAAALVAQSQPRARFVLVGADPSPGGGRGRRLAERALRLGLQERLRFVGGREDVPALMAALDVLLHCAHSESFGRVLVEAMAAGRPVVASDVGGVAEVVEEGRTGLLFARGDAPGAARAVLELLADAGARKRLGEAGRERALALFGAAAHAQQVQALYGELLER